MPARSVLTGKYRVVERPKVTTALSPIRDAFVWDKEPTLNYGDVQDIAVGRSGGYLTRGLVQFDVSTLRTDLIILSAVLRLRCRFAGSGQIGVYPLLGAWDEYGVTWANQPPAAPVPVATAAAPARVGDAVEFDITDLFMSWYQRTRTNYGVGLRVTDETAMAATLFGAREAGADWQPQLLVTYYEPDALADVSDLSSSATVRGLDGNDEFSVGYVGVISTFDQTSRGMAGATPDTLPTSGTVHAIGVASADQLSSGEVGRAPNQLSSGGSIHRQQQAGNVDPCTAIEEGHEVLLWEGPYAELADSPYAPLDPMPSYEAILRVPGFWVYGEYNGWPIWALSEPSSYVFRSEPPVVVKTIIVTPEREYKVVATRVWRDVAPPRESPWYGEPSYYTHWLVTLPVIPHPPRVSWTWYFHAVVVSRSATGLGCSMASRGQVNRREILSTGTAIQVSSLPTSGLVRGPELEDLPAASWVSRLETPAAGVPRLAAWSELASLGAPRLPAWSSLASAGTADIGPNSLPTVGIVSDQSDILSLAATGRTPDQLPSAGSVPDRIDLPSLGSTGVTPDQLPSAGSPRVPAWKDLSSIAHANTPWMAAQGIVHEHSNLFSRGNVRIHSGLPTVGFVAFGGLSELPSNGWPRIRDASDLLSTALAKVGHSDLGSRGIVTAIVLEIDIDLRAWPPEGRSVFPST